MKTAIFTKDYVTLKGGIAACFLIFQLFCLPVFADNSEIIRLNGLSFVCSHCELREGPPCRVSFLDASRITSCDEALAQLLEQSVRGKFNPEHPSPSELRTLLLNTTQRGTIAELALNLLLRTDAGRRALIQDAYVFASRYSLELSRAVSVDAEQKEVWRTFWNLPSQEGVSIAKELRAKILAYSPNLSAQDLFVDLSILPSAEDVRDLELYEQTLEGRRPELAVEIRKVREHLQRCENGRTDGSDDTGCKAADLSEPASRFINRVRIQWLIHSTETGVISMPDFIDRLNHLSFEKSRTPALHETLIKAIEFANQHSEIANKIASPEYFPMFRIFSANDRVLGTRWVGLLTKQADEFFRAGKFDESLSLLEESFKAMAEPVEARIAFLNTIVYSEAWRERPDIRTRFREVVRRGVPARPWYELSTEKLVGVFSILSGLTFVWMMYYYVDRQRKATAERAALEAEMTALSEREEIRVLRAFFDIRSEDGEAELTKSYRRKAKETHPDLYGGQTEKFQEVQDKYQRAKELLARRSSP